MPLIRPTPQENYLLSIQTLKTDPNERGTPISYADFYINGQRILSSNPTNPYANLQIMAAQFNVPESFWPHKKHQLWIATSTLGLNFFNPIWQEITQSNPTVTSLSPLTVMAPSQRFQADLKRLNAILNRLSF